MSCSCSDPTLMWTDTASAPRRTASLTLQSCIFQLGSLVSRVAPERWTMRPSCVVSTVLAGPACTRIASAPPFATWFTVFLQRTPDEAGRFAPYFPVHENENRGCYCENSEHVDVRGTEGVAYSRDHPWSLF